MFHEFIYEFGCTKLSDGSLAYTTRPARWNTISGCQELWHSLEHILPADEKLHRVEKFCVMMCTIQELSSEQEHWKCHLEGPCFHCIFKEVLLSINTVIQMATLLPIVQLLL